MVLWWASYTFNNTAREWKTECHGRDSHRKGNSNGKKHNKSTFQHPGRLCNTLVAISMSVSSGGWVGMLCLL